MFFLPKVMLNLLKGVFLPTNGMFFTTNGKFFAFLLVLYKIILNFE
jgi:hypothetical protein